MPFNLGNAAQTSQRFIHDVFRGLDGVYPYLDYILVAGSSQEEHCIHLRSLFPRLSHHGVTIHLAKCSFGAFRVASLGHSVSASGIEPFPDKVQATVDYPEHTSFKQLRRFDDLTKQEVFYGILAVIGGIMIHFTFGHFYTIANMVTYIMGYTIDRVQPNVNEKLAIWLSALALGVQGISMPLGGMAAQKLGYRVVVGASCLLVSGGVLLTYITVQKSFIGVIITYSLMKGAGLGFGYSVVLAVATTWFPARRGLVVGMIVGGFGLGALIFTPIQTAYINPDNVKVNNVTRQMTDAAVLDRVPSAFLMLGGILLGLQVIGFILLRPRPVSTTELGDKKVEDGKKKDTGDLDNAPGIESEGMLKEKSEESLKGSRAARIDRSYRDDEVEEENLQPKQVIRRLDFYLLWLVMFCNIIPITIITSIYKYFGQEYISDDFFLSSVATVSALFNCGGRIMWGAIVDKISFKAAGSLVCGVITTLVEAKNAYLVQFTGCGCVCLIGKLFICVFWITNGLFRELSNTVTDETLAHNSKHEHLASQTGQFVV
ncbi:uncharacterized protein DEA37_0000230 [Paragonimus westermani]|uniref:Major facilitator superfamily (MFS) profile domain-containing protein n=1 Tax=Paragonimus westermani TaxID=34504 RepID=A0A5J4NXU9_9TREM|nr:uncharacterized protein DEA37_0000230 [Paragonimus westermani]